MADATTFNASAQPVLNRDDAARFLAMLAPDEEQFLFTSFDDDKERARRQRAGGEGVPAAVRRGDLDRVWRWAAGRQALGANICCTVQSVRGTERRKQDVQAVRAIFGEFDENPRQPFPLAPSIIVSTSPGKMHAYWLTDAEAPVLIEDFDGVQRRIVADYGADAGARDIARTLRMPGTWNLKPGRAPYLAKIIGGNGARYGRDEILAAFPPVVPENVMKGPKPDFAKVSTRGGMGRFVEPLKSIAPDDYFSWLEVGMALHQESGGGSAGLRMWDAWSASSEKWSPEECPYRWGTFRTGGGVTGGKIFELAKQGGYVKPAPPRSWQTHVGAVEEDESETATLPGVEPAAKSWLPLGFRKRRDGELEFLAGGDDEGDENWQWLCSQIEVAAETSDENNLEHGRLVRVRDRQNDCWHQWAMPMRLLSGEPSVYRGEFLSMGARLSSSRKAREALGGLLQNARPDKDMRCVTRTGWFEKSFVFPDRAIGEAEGRGAVFQSNGTVTMKFRSRGTLAEWQEHVAALAVGNSRLTLAICAAFAAPCLRLVGQDGGGFHFYGQSSDGKTTGLRAAGSVWGGSDSSSGYLESWSATANGLEGAARIHSDCLLCLEEMGQADPDAVIDAAYKLANGKGKQRMSADAQLRPSAHWRVLFLSDGEITLDTKIAESRRGGRKMAGQAVRVVDIFADAGKDLGAFDTIHGRESGSAFSEEIVGATQRYYGTAAPAFLERLAADFDNVAARLGEDVNRFVRANAANCGGQVQRVAKRFGLLAAASELAVEWGILPWESGDATKHVARCFKGWREARGTDGPIEIEQGIAQVRQMIEAHGSSRFTRWEKGLVQVVPNSLGFVKYINSNDAEAGRHFYINSGGWQEICKGFSPATIAKTLRAMGALLVGDDGKMSTKARPPGHDSNRYYVINADALFGEVEQVEQVEQSEKPVGE